MCVDVLVILICLSYSDVQFCNVSWTLDLAFCGAWGAYAIKHPTWDGSGLYMDGYSDWSHTSFLFPNKILASWWNVFAVDKHLSLASQSMGAILSGIPVSHRSHIPKPFQWAWPCHPQLFWKFIPNGMGVCFWRGCLTSLTASLLVRVSILTRTIRDEESLTRLFLEREIENTPFIVKASCEKNIPWCFF